MSVDYRRKLYALLHNPQASDEGEIICQQLVCLENFLVELKRWWQDYASDVAVKIANTSDRVNLQLSSRNSTKENIEIRHPISGQKQTLILKNSQDKIINLIPQEVKECSDPQIVYWWFWRFFPELKNGQQQDLLLYPANEILPDCPWHSFQATVSALVGAIYPENWQPEDEKTNDSDKRPYLFLFTFSPVQEFIKSSRKFLDFWAGSYLLHYLGARLCWKIAEKYGPDAVIRDFPKINTSKSMQ